MNDTLIRILVACGWVAAGVSGFGTALFVAGSPVAGGQAAAYATPALFIALAFGIYRNSRLCALAALIIFTAMRFEFYRIAQAVQQSHGGAVTMGFWVSAIAFGILYLAGAVGTFAWHARHPQAAAPTFEA